MKNPLVSLFVLIALPCLAGELVPVAELGQAKPFGAGVGSLDLSVEEGRLAAKAPNFWSMSWQIENMVGFSEPVDRANLAVRASGRSNNQSLTMKVILMGPDWRGADIYKVSLAGLADEPATFTADNPVGEPDEKIGDGLGGRIPAHLQILLEGEGDQPVEMTFEAIGFLQAGQN